MTIAKRQALRVARHEPGFYVPLNDGNLAGTVDASALHWQSRSALRGPWRRASFFRRRCVFTDTAAYLPARLWLYRPSLGFPQSPPEAARLISASSM